jgi:hypothetical protein
MPSEPYGMTGTDGIYVPHNFTVNQLGRNENVIPAEGIGRATGFWKMDSIELGQYTLQL